MGTATLNREDVVQTGRAARTRLAAALHEQAEIRRQSAERQRARADSVGGGGDPHATARSRPRASTDAGLSHGHARALIAPLDLDGGTGAGAGGHPSARAMMRKQASQGLGARGKGRASTAGAAAKALGSRASALPAIPVDKAAAAATAKPTTAPARRLLGSGEARPPTPMRRPPGAEARPTPSVYSASPAVAASRHEPSHRSARPKRGILSASPRQQLERHRRRVARLRQHLERHPPSGRGDGVSGSSGSEWDFSTLRFADEEGLPLACEVHVHDYHYSSDGDTAPRSRARDLGRGPDRVKLASGALVSPRVGPSSRGVSVGEEEEEEEVGAAAALWTGFLGIFSSDDAPAPAKAQPVPGRASNTTAITERRTAPSQANDDGDSCTIV